MAKGVNGQGDGPDYSGVINSEALNRYVDRIERLHNERRSLNEDIKEVYGQAKDAGFDTTVLREIVRERQMEEPARHSRYALLDSYRRALGMLADTPLGAAAMRQAETEAQPAASGKRVSKPRPFAQTPVGSPRRKRGRPRKVQSVDEALGAARAHLAGEEPKGNA